MAGCAWSWEDFRTQAERDGCLSGVIEAELAGWMDEGMFARWVLSGLPSPDEMMVAARSGLSPSAARRLDHAVHLVGAPQRVRAAG